VVGASSGALIAAFSIGGPLVVAWLSHVGLKALALRATLILFFFVVDLVAISGLGLAGAIPNQTLTHALYLVPALLVGLWIGQQLFIYIRAETAARFTQWLLLALAGFGLLGHACPESKEVLMTPTLFITGATSGSAKRVLDDLPQQAGR